MNRCTAGVSCFVTFSRVSSGAVPQQRLLRPHRSCRIGPAIERAWAHQRFLCGSASKKVFGVSPQSFLLSVLELPLPGESTHGLSPWKASLRLGLCPSAHGSCRTPVRGRMTPTGAPTRCSERINNAHGRVFHSIAAAFPAGRHHTQRDRRQRPSEITTPPATECCLSVCTEQIQMQ